MNSTLINENQFNERAISNTTNGLRVLPIVSSSALLLRSDKNLKKRAKIEPCTAYGISMRLRC